MADQSTFEMMRTTEREARRQVIIESAIRMLNRRPFIEIGMRDIAAEAGVSAASIYRYFPGRNDLLVEALTYQIVQIIEDFDQRTVQDPFDLVRLAEYVVDYLMDNEATFQMMSYLMIMGEMSPKMLERFNLVQRRFLNAFGLMLAQSGIKGDLRLFSQAFFASLAGVAMTYRNYPGRRKEEIRRHMKRLARIIARLFQQGLPDHESGQV